MDIFLKNDVRRVFKGKSVLFMGDSILRNIYQDFLWLMEKGTLTPAEMLKKKGEDMKSFCGDRLIPGTGEKTAGRDYWEERRFSGGVELGHMTVDYCFLTRCYSDRVVDYIGRYNRTHNRPPDLVVILSALWDINRWGPGGIDAYVRNCPNLLQLLSATFPASTQVIWLTSPPIDVEVWGGFLVEGLEFQKHSMRFNVLEGNQMVANTCAAHSCDVVDLHYWMLHQMHKRMPDGIHWTADAVRLQLNLLLTHFCLSRDIDLPNTIGESDERPNRPLESARKIANQAVVADVERDRVESNNEAPPRKRMREDSDDIHRI